MLNLAKRQLVQTMTTLDPMLRDGMPVVGLEPACVAAFRDELIKLYPKDERAERLSRQTFILSEFLIKQKDYSLPPLHRKALLHTHCHHHAVIGIESDETLLSRLGMDYTLLNSGCCGMAGPFGFEADHYDLSLKIGERILLPAVRNANRDTLIIADGYSCREQIAQITNRRALHLAQVLHMALHDGKDGPPGDFPERLYTAPSGFERQEDR